MKNKATFLVPLVLIVVSYVMLSYTIKTEDVYTKTIHSENIEIPEDVKLVLENKCMGCHSTDSKNAKSKMKLNFDKFTNGKYSTGKLVSKFGKITKQLNKSKMPPEKFLKKYPDKKLSEEESGLLISWATEQKKALSSE